MRGENFPRQRSAKLRGGKLWNACKQGLPTFEVETRRKKKRKKEEGAELEESFEE